MAVGGLGMENGSRGRAGRDWMILALVALIALVMVLAGCHKKEPGVGEAAVGQKTFASADDAAKSLAEAARSDNQTELLAIFGPDSKDILYSGNAAEDRASITGFAAAYDKMHRWRKLDNANQMLLVGASNTAFPVPLRKERRGGLYFDTPAGKSEIIARRIGRNELAAIDVCAALVDAQTEYYAQNNDKVKQYARKFISEPGKQNGLYWPAESAKSKSPLGPLVAYATADGRSVQSSLYQPFHGYYFAMLTTQGANAPGGLKDYVRDGAMSRGFAFVAYPARYGETGTMTFVVSRDRVIYQKDLGPTTGDVASVMSQYNPNGSWSEVKQ
jgi:hypothetical protein